MWVSTLTILQLADVCAVRLSQARRWVRAGVIKPIRSEGQAYVYGRDDAVVGAVLKLLQQTLGEKSPLPLSLAADLRPGSSAGSAGTRSPDTAARSRSP